AALGEPFEAELVGGRGGDLRAGSHVRRMDLANQHRIFQQQFGRPERIAQVGPAPFELGGQAAVEKDRAATKSLPERHVRKVWRHGPLTSTWIKGVSAPDKRLPWPICASGTSQPTQRMARSYSDHQMSASVNPSGKGSSSPST